MQRIQTGLLQDMNYAYDAVGNVMSIVGPDTVSFTYDELDRLTGASGAYGESYGYSGNDGKIGNLTSKTGVGTYGYNDAAHKHAVTHLNGVQKYWYDQNGNMTRRDTSTGSYYLGYDTENRLTSVSGAASASFVYDGDGNRVKGTVSGVTTAYPSASLWASSGQHGGHGQQRGRLERRGALLQSTP